MFTKIISIILIKINQFENEINNIIQVLDHVL